MLKVWFNLDVCFYYEVVVIDLIEKVIIVKYEIEILIEYYDKLILLLGVKFFVLLIIGLVEVKNVFLLRNVFDLD